MRIDLAGFFLVLIGLVGSNSIVNQAAETNSISGLNDWLATTDAELTFVYDKSVLPAEYSKGDPTMDITMTNPALLSVVAPFATRVVYCNRRTGPICGGSCTVYNGGSRCLNAPGTDCLYASNNIAFCDRRGCRGSCNWFTSCGTKLERGFCYTPGTSSINVPFTG